MSFLKVENVTKAYTGHTALNGVSIEVPKGKVFGLLGPNGAGKTTLIRIINRITMPDTGEVLFDGRPLCADDVMRIGYLPEERGLYKKMKVGEQAIYLARLKGLSYEEACSRLHYWFEKFGIMPWWDKKLEELSKGMQQKVQFVITVLHEPPLLIFDEPFSGFDPVNAELLKREILELRDKGHTIIFSTHNMSSVEEVCDEIALIDHSQVVLQGNVEEVKQRFCEGIYTVEGMSETLLETTAEYEVLGHQRVGHVDSYSIRAAAEMSGSQLIAHLAKKIEIQRFSIQLPTMQEIFLRVVGKSQE